MALLDSWALAQGLKTATDIDQLISRCCVAPPACTVLSGADVALHAVYQSDSRVLPVLRDRLVGPL